MPNAILLDLDDTILDDSGKVGQCWREACLSHELDSPNPDALTVQHAIERTGRWYWSDPERHRTGRRGCRLALVTNGDANGQRAKIDRFGLR